MKQAITLLLSFLLVLTLGACSHQQQASSEVVPDTEEQQEESGDSQLNTPLKEPEIKPIQIDLSQYDRIIMGTPVWWYTFAPAVKSFLSKYSLSEKTIYPFATNGGWLGHTFEDFKAAMPETDVKEGLNIVFDGKRQKTPDVEIRKWISALQ